MIARPNAFPYDRRTVIFVVTLALAFSVACGGREDGDPQVSPSKASEPTPSITTETSTDGSGAGKPLFTDEEAKNIAALTEQRRAANRMGNKTIRIEPEPGRNTIDLPDDFPADVPLPASASPTRYVSSPQDGTMMTVVIDESPGSAHGYFLDELEDQGWYVETTGATEDLTILSASKGDRVLAVAITNVDGETTVTLLESRE